ncbi:hypothetical protein G7078_02890 [Sphingomonas sinipercae]|uniref:Uncharacterized protein n=1 Tax=Sphingomonas sinipercae TaxID=2714944 RepID=A0A6G7ZLR0_9SPHN|nr:hypothetical protein [Sphingomonas sinipercae]QIL01836.1 hypothetical protein G7078_02890 [Sphingomonas sinipercae]
MTIISEPQPGIPAFAALAADPEIAPLLEFDPAPRKVDRPDGWTPELQRELIARIAATGSPGEACKAIDKNLSGAKHLYRSHGAGSFRQAWKAAIALAASRKRAERAAAPRGFVDVPGTLSRGKGGAAVLMPLPGQVLNEKGEWEDEASMQQRMEDARESITGKLLRARRLYLKEISTHPARRAAFEILTDIPVDWEKAERLDPQPDEPWHRANMRQPDMVLMAQAGWIDELTTARGNKKKRQLMEDINAYRAEQGLEAVDWDEGEEELPFAQRPLPL